MTESDQGRGESESQYLSDASRKRAHTDAVLREYNYSARLSADEAGLLTACREVLVSSCADFAEIFYNYLFDHPGIAEILYAFESEGGDVGAFARECLSSLLASLQREHSALTTSRLLAIGGQYQQLKFRSAWIVGGYSLFIGYLQKLLPSLEIAAVERHQLESILSRMLLLDLGLVLDGYHEAFPLPAHHHGQPHAHSASHAESLLSGLPHYLWSVDVGDNRILYSNASLRSLCDDQPEAPIPVIDNVAGQYRRALMDAWQDAVGGKMMRVDLRMKFFDADEHWYRVSMYPDMDTRGKVVKVYCLLEDIDAQINERIELQHLATTDALTGLPNRSLWLEHLNMALAGSRRVPGSGVVVMALDINQFKMYNDTLGLDVGDRLLRDIARRLESLVRESDSLARLGGDRFGILIRSVVHYREATERVITKIMDSFDLPFSCDDRQLYINLTTGIACFPNDGVDSEALLVNAESALRRARRNGLPYQYFDPLNDVNTLQQLRYSGQIRSALENDELELHYQPLVDLQTSRVTGVEALLRWDHPGEGIIMPHRIIPLAEELGIMHAITDWVLATALQQCRYWQGQGIQLRVSINVSANSFQNPRLPEKISSALQHAGVSGNVLEIEITEATLMQDTERAGRILRKLSEQGITIAIDDFGTGYSSLSYLKHLPIHTLKIDQSFIADVVFDQQDIAIVRSIIELGHNLGYQVVAEGVESSNAWELLARLGCDSAQGFHICKPLTEQGLGRLLAERQHLPG